MPLPRQRPINAVYMRGGTSKGVFFVADDLPADPAVRDRILLRVIGSPDRYGKQIDGMGGATSSTSKVVILSKSARPDCDVDYRFGQVAIDRPVVDWSGNCGNLSAAVGPFAIASGLVQAPADGVATVRIWQANIAKKIIAHVPMQDGEVVELGDFELDGVAFAAAEVRLEFLDPAADVAEATRRAATPKLAFVAAPAAYTASDGTAVAASSIDLLARIFSMGPLHHAMTGTGAVAIAAAAAIPGTLVHRIAPTGADGRVRFGLPSGTLTVGAEAEQQQGQWTVRKVIMSRSARRLMQGQVLVPPV